MGVPRIISTYPHTPGEIIKLLGILQLIEQKPGTMNTATPNKAEGIQCPKCLYYQVVQLLYCSTDRNIKKLASEGKFNVDKCGPKNTRYFCKICNQPFQFCSLRKDDIKTRGSSVSDEDSISS